MLTLELMTELKTALENETLDKAEITRVLKVLTEFEAIEKEATELKKIIKELRKEKQINEYIESDGVIYCLESLKQFELIRVEESNLTDIAETVKQINQQINVIDKSEQKIAELYSQKDILINKVFLETENKAVKNAELLILKGSVNDKLIFLKD
jgi:hypothetical protein